MGILSQLEAATIVHIKICKDSTRPPPSTPNAARPGPSYVAGWTAAAPAAAVSPTLQAPKGTEERHQDDSRSSAQAVTEADGEKTPVMCGIYPVILC